MPVSHPTIVVGFGHYGRTVLEALLASAATRGVLAWEDAPGGASRAARRLKDLALVSVSYSSGVEEGAMDLIPPDAGSPEIVEDLDRQIRRIDSEHEPSLTGALAEAKARLLSVAQTANNPDRLRLGLDVIVLAQPRTRSMLGFLAETLEPALDELANDLTLKRPIEGLDLLNCIEILDFENYWDRSPAGVALRREVRYSVERMVGRRPGVGRVYLVDGRTLDGTRPPQLRLDEVVLLLEFLLFEGQRAAPHLQSLYQRERDATPPIVAVGLRLFERSTGRLSRLAAAYFGQGWLEHMASSSTPPNSAGRRELAHALDGYGPGRLYSEDERERFRAIAEAEIRELQTQVLSLDPDLPSWPSEARRVIQKRIRALNQRLTAEMAERSRQLQEERVRGLSARLSAEVTTALHHETEPQPVCAVVDELARLAGEAQEFDIPSDPGPPDRPSELSAALDEAHRHYVEFRDEQVNPAASRPWWWLLATAMTAGLTPIVVGVLADLSPVDPAAPHWWRIVAEGAGWWGAPLLVAGIVFGAGVLLGRWGLQRRIESRVDRGLRFFIDRARGRLADAIQAALDEGPVRQNAIRLADSAYRELARRLRGEVRSELERVRRLLEERRREMEWLRDQLRRYLRTQGIEPDRPAAQVDASAGSPGVLRHAIDREQDLQEMLARNPPGPDRYRSTQSQRRPFEDWQQRFSDAFLYPVGFLDALSALYVDVRREGLDQHERDVQARALVKALALRHAHDFHPAFYCPPGAGEANAPRRVAVFPLEWGDHPDVVRGLKDYGYEPSLRGGSPDRAYLLCIQLGIATSVLDATP